MKRIVALGILAAVAGAPAVANAEASGSRMQAGGGFMSSYVADPHHDPRSLHSQNAGTGQILGAPMLSENAGAKGRAVPGLRVGEIEPNWSSATRARRFTR